MFLYHAVPRLAGRPVTSRALGWVLFVVWNFLFVIPGWVLVMAGWGQWVEWAEFPHRHRCLRRSSAFVLMAVQFVHPVAPGTARPDLYVSAWYILGAIVFTLLAYPVGNFVPEVGARSARGDLQRPLDPRRGRPVHHAARRGDRLLRHPDGTGRPIFSHFLSMLAFWMLFFIYPLNGTHHYIFSSIPMEAQIGAIVASVYLGMDVVLNVSNLLLSLRGSARRPWPATCRCATPG